MCLSLSFFSLSLLFLFLQIPEAEKKDPNELVGEFTYFYVHTYVWSKRKKSPALVKPRINLCSWQAWTQLLSKNYSEPYWRANLLHWVRCSLIYMNKGIVVYFASIPGTADTEYLQIL